MTRRAFERSCVSCGVVLSFLPELSRVSRRVAIVRLFQRLLSAVRGTQCWGKHFTYPAVALVFLSFDCYSLLTSGRMPWRSLLVATVIAGGMAAAAWFSTLGSVTVIAVSCLAIISPASLLDALMTTFLVVLATAELISQNRWVLVVISGVAVSGAYYLEPVDRSGALLVWLLLLQMVIAVSIGLLMLTSSKQIELLKQQVEYLAHRTNTELAVTLHDTVITDLTKALVMVRSLQVPNRDQPLYALADIEQSIARAITQLRRTVTMLQPRNDPMNESVSHALDDAAQMLRMGRRRLHSALPDEHELSMLLGATRLRFLVVFLKEALMNCVKYAPVNSIVNVSADVSERGVEVTVVSDLSKEELDLQLELSSGLGIMSLQSRAQTLGGDVYFGTVPGRWIISLVMPIDAARIGGVE